MDARESSGSLGDVRSTVSRQVNARILALMRDVMPEASEAALLCECGREGCCATGFVPVAEYDRTLARGQRFAVCTARRIPLRGDLDLYELEIVQASLDAALAFARQVTVDLTGVRFIDSTILGAFVAASRAADARNATIEFVVPPEGPIARALRLAGLDRVLRVSAPG